MSDPATAPEKPPVRVWRRAGIALAVLVAALVVVGAIGNRLDRQRAQGKLRALEEALDESDPDWRLHEIEAARPQVPDAENSALVVMAAVRLVPRGWSGQRMSELLDSEPPPPTEQLDQERIEILEKELPALEPSLTQARRLADMPRGRHRLTFAHNPVATLLPDQGEVRRIASLLRYEALRRAQEGEIDAALRACRGCVNAGRSLGDEPLMISQMIRIACVGLGCNTAERVLAQGQATEKELAELQKLLALEDEHPTFRTAARGERAMTHDLLGKMSSGEISSRDFERELHIAERPLYRRWFGPRVTRRDQTENLVFMTKLVETTRLPEGDQAAAQRALDAELRRGRPEGKVWQMLMPASTKVGEACRRKTEQVRVLLALLAVERYRLKHGKWPEKLEDLKPGFLTGVPVDPYDGGPLRYKKLPGGVAVYSVGHDGKDDGGKLDRRRSNASGFDQGYQLWDVKRRRQPARPKPAPAPVPEEQK